MKGLLIKDFRLMKSQALFLIIIMVVSIVCSALLENPFFAMGYATALISVFSINTISFDEYENGMVYLFTLPVSRKLYVKEKYTYALIITTAALVISTIIAIGVSVMKDIPYTTKEWMGILALSVFIILFVLTVIIPVRMKYDAEKHKMVMLIAFGGIFLFFYLAAQIAEWAGIDVEAFFDGKLINSGGQMLVSGVAVGIVLLYVSYRISVKIMERREF